jgi:RNA polymerase sigma-70 factor (ECF subfamily)
MNDYDKQFKTMYLQFFKPLTVFSHKYTHDLEVAEDVVQNVFLSLYESQNHLKIHISLKAYLYRAVYNQTMDVLKRESRKILGMNTNEMLQEEFRDQMEEAEFGQKIQLAIEALPQGCRNVFLMSRYEGISNKDISIKLNISIRTVETQISKALKILRERIYTILAFILLFLEMNQ